MAKDIGDRNYVFYHRADAPNAGCTGLFSVRVSGWRESPAAWLIFCPLGSIEHFMQAKATKIVLIVVGAVLLAFGLFNTGSDILGSFSSGGSDSARYFTLMIRTPWVLVTVCGALLCVIGLFTGKKQGR